MKITNIYKLILLGFSLSPLYGAIYYNDLNVTGGVWGTGTGWTGDGTVSANASAAGVVTNVLLLDGFSSGTLMMGEVSPAGPNPYINPGVTASMTMTVSGSGVGGSASADFLMDSNVASGGFNNFSIGNLANANTVEVCLTFSEPLAASKPAAGSTNGAPFLLAIGGLGSNLASAYTLDASYSGLTHSFDGSNFTAGLPSTGSNPEQLLWNTTAPWGTDMTWDGTAGTGTGTNIPFGANGSSTKWHGIHGFDITTGDAFSHTTAVGDTMLYDEEKVYATGICFTVSRTDGADFDPNTEFVFSSSGQQWDQTIAGAVPEPSSALLLGMGGLALAARRKK